MKIGFLTDYSEDIVRWAAVTGFRSLELSAGPDSPLDPLKLTRAADRQAVRDLCARHGVEISALCYYTNHLHPDPARRKASNARFLALIEMAAEMGVSVVCTFAGARPDKSIPETIPEWKKVWSRYVTRAEKHGVKLAIENCPMFCGWPFRTNHNIAYRPEAWDLMFEALPSEALGLEYDPSHLFWLHIDYIDAIRTYGPRIYHVHAKDTEIHYDRFAREGIYGGDWWRYRVPGWGEIDWKEVIAALLDAGYAGNLDIEHEDPVFHGERHKEGLRLGLKHLQQFVAGD